jgi:chromate transport protein ChrA
MRRYERWLNSLVTHEQIARDLFVESPLAHPTAMLLARTLRSLGGYRDQGWPEDYDLWMRAYAAGLRFAKVPRCLYWWRERADRLSRVHGAYSPAAFRRCKVHHLKALHLCEESVVTIWGAGKEGKALARHLRRENIAIAAFVDVDPRKIGMTVLGAPVAGVGGLTRDHYLLAFGGGFASVPLMLHAVVDVKRWLGTRAFMDGIALGQVTPGPIVITATFVGYQVKGLAGAVIATAAIFTPSFVVLLAAVPYFDRLQRSVVFRSAMRGVLASFVGLLVSTAITFVLAAHWSPFLALLAGAAFVALMLKADLLLVVMAGGAAAALSHYVRL